MCYWAVNVSVCLLLLLGSECLSVCLLLLLGSECLSVYLLGSECLYLLGSVSVPVVVCVNILYVVYEVYVVMRCFNQKLRLRLSIVESDDSSIGRALLTAATRGS